MTILKVFVYGTLKPGHENHNRYCRDRLLESQAAKVKGKLYRLSVGYPGMTHGDNWVQGFILTLQEEGSTLKDLDALEDYDPRRQENLYQREMTDVFSLNGDFIEQMWVYYMSMETIQKLNGELIASGKWTL